MCRSASSISVWPAAAVADHGGAACSRTNIAEVGRHLVVARASRVELSADRADHLGQPALDRRVDVLVAGCERELRLLELVEHASEPVEQLVAL